MDTLDPTLSAHQKLLANLAAVQRQVLDDSVTLDSNRTSPLRNVTLEQDLNISSEIDVDDAVRQIGERYQNILLDSASSQGNSGILSIMPPTVGPSSSISGGTMSASNDVDAATWNTLPGGILPKYPFSLDPVMQKQTNSTVGPQEETPQSKNASNAESFPGWGMVARMRTWRQGAIMQHLYQTAVFWGDKIFSWTGEPTDAFWLAQTYFLMADYRRAEAILMSPLRVPSAAVETPEISGNLTAGYGGTAIACTLKSAKATSPLAKRLSRGQEKVAWMKRLCSSAKASVWGVMNPVSPESDQQHSIDVVDRGCLPRGPLVNWSMPCRYLAALCLLHQERLVDAISLLGESNPFIAGGRNHRNSRSETGDIKLEASMCRLRGILYLRLNSLQLAKESFMESLALDIRNYDVFLELSNSMMTPEEEWHFLHTLAINDQLHPEDAHFVRLVYTARLHSNPHMREISAAKASLACQFNLEANPDIRATIAQDFFNERQWEKCHDLTSSILQDMPNHREALPLHLACLTQLPRLASSLFMLAHRLVNDETLSAISWYAIGLWYFTGHRWVDARRHFAATHELDARFSPAWICFAHCFAYDGEHEQAITAYSTTARIFPGTHLPFMCIGMEYMQLNNLTMAQDALHTAYTLCETDPTLLNEMGVLRYYSQEYDVAVKLFTEALQLASCLPASQTIWADIYCNLAHCERRRRNISAAETLYLRAVKHNALSSGPYTGLGMIAEVAGNINHSIERYHQALALSPQDAVTTVLLESVLFRQEALAKSILPSSSAASLASLLG